MVKRKEKIKECKPKCVTCKTGGFYGLGFIGALIYYISTATSFWIGVFGIVKAILWPAFLVFEALKFIGA